MDMDQPGATPLSMAMDPSATSTTSDSMSGTDHDSMSMSDSHSMSSMRMGASQMDMTFFTSTHTPLFSTAWTPNGTGTYAATCVFLIFLSLMLRFLYVCKFALEQKWRGEALNRRWVVTQGRGRIEDRDNQDNADDDEGLRGSGSEAGAQQDTQTEVDKSGARVGVLTANGIQQNVRILEDRSSSPSSRTQHRRNGAAGILYGAQAFRLSVDGPRAILVMVMVGVAYLLMLAVMTMNVGYFLSVLAGAFLGELLLGRYVAGHGTVVGGH
ncbi:MAG: hypothetical protein M1831_004598 [Alyxoria varia]|nr:MAG: hypothetical protein M1831_004598 [Alyxoria varia]